MQLDEFVVLYRSYSDLNIYIMGGESDNELVSRSESRYSQSC